jgi:hypothetical protein
MNACMTAQQGTTVSGNPGGTILPADTLAQHPDMARLSAALSAPQAAVRARLNAVILDLLLLGLGSQLVVSATAGSTSPSGRARANTLSSIISATGAHDDVVEVGAEVWPTAVMGTTRRYALSSVPAQTRCSAVAARRIRRPRPAVVLQPTRPRAAGVMDLERTPPRWCHREGVARDLVPTAMEPPGDPSERRARDAGGAASRWQAEVRVRGAVCAADDEAAARLRRGMRRRGDEKPGGRNSNKGSRHSSHGAQHKFEHRCRALDQIGPRAARAAREVSVAYLDLAD